MCLHIAKSPGDTTLMGEFNQIIGLTTTNYCLHRTSTRPSDVECLGVRTNGPASRPEYDGGAEPLGISQRSPQRANHNDAVSLTTQAPSRERLYVQHQILPIRFELTLCRWHYWTTVLQERQNNTLWLGFTARVPNNLAKNPRLAKNAGNAPSHCEIP